MDSAADLSNRIGDLVETLQEHGKVLRGIDARTAEIHSDFRKIRLIAYTALAISLMALCTACATATYVSLITERDDRTTLIAV